MTGIQIYQFVEESNRIEGIHRSPSAPELGECARFMTLAVVTVEELQAFLAIYQPDAVLRDKAGLNVRVGKHRPPPGGPEIRGKLTAILEGNQSAWEQHLAYEKLHPFTDGNGRSGRMLWASQMGATPLGFLHEFYYQTLSANASGSRITPKVAPPTFADRSHGIF